MLVMITTIDSHTGVESTFAGVEVSVIDGAAIATAYHAELVKTGWVGKVPRVLAWVDVGTTICSFILQDEDVDGYFGSRALICGFVAPYDPLTSSRSPFIAPVVG